MPQLPFRTVVRTWWCSRASYHRAKCVLVSGWVGRSVSWYIVRSVELEVLVATTNTNLVEVNMEGHVLWPTWFRTPTFFPVVEVR